MGNGHMGPRPHCDQTDACENITFLQLCLQAVKIGNKKMNIRGGRMDFMFLGLFVPKTNISIAPLTPKAANIKGKLLSLLYLLNSSCYPFLTVADSGFPSASPWDLPMFDVSGTEKKTNWAAPMFKQMDLW